jgi:protein PsiE
LPWISVPTPSTACASFQRRPRRVEYAGLLVIAFATTIAMYQEAMVMVEARRVALADLLLMFLYLEVLAMIGQYFKSGQLPVRFPALHRHGGAGALPDPRHQGHDRVAHAGGHRGDLPVDRFGVLVIRYGHVRYPYREDAESDPGKAYVRE